MKIDFHIHTIYSGHSLLKIKDIQRYCKKKHIDMVAVTDHNTIKGAQQLNSQWNIIIGEEIQTDKGEIIGLFLQEEIAPGSLADVIDTIRNQDGIIYIPHPFDRFRKSAITDKNFIHYADIVEVFNARTINQQDNLRAYHLAEKHQKIKGVGSDAHTHFEIGNAYVEMEPFTSKQEFLRNIQNSTLFGRRSPMWVHAISKMLKVIR